MSRVGREEVQEFVKDQLRKGYIRPSKSPQTSLVFFVPKKDGKKRMVQDYQYLNSCIIRQECGRTLARVRVSRTYISIIIISLQWT